MRVSENRNVKNGLNLRLLFVIMASKRKSDDVNVVAPDKTKELTGSGGNGSLISDHYQNILNNWQSKQEFMGKSFTNDGI